MPMTTEQLAAEIANDPAGLGYAGKTDGQIRVLLNTVTATDVFRNDIAAKEIVNAIVAADFASLNVTQLSKLQLMLIGGTLDATNSNTRTIFLGIFSGMTATITALTAVAQRKGTRAEVLWGSGTVVTNDQIAGAR